jgi:hypothetical protein
VPNDDENEELVIGLVSISDRASTGVYEDKGIPALQEWLDSALTTPWRAETRLIADDQPTIENTLIELVDRSNCHLVLTTGGTGPALARCHAGSDAGRRRQGNARLRRGNAPHQPELCADRHSFAPGCSHPQTGADHQPARPAESRSRKRWKACAMLKARSRMSAFSPPCRIAST